MAQPPQVPDDVIRQLAGIKRITAKQREGVWAPNTTGYSPEQFMGWRDRQQLRSSGLLGKTGNNRDVDPFAGLGRTPTAKEFVARAEFWQSAEADRDSWYDPDRPYNNLGYEPLGADRSPAPLSAVPTSTSNPKRPRTVAAGWQATADGGTLTVVFRDGTYYNYYDVDQQEWEEFKTRVSKGRFIYDYLDMKPRGPADTSTMDARVRAVIERLYVVARAGQQYRYRKGTKRVTDPITGKSVGTYRNKKATGAAHKRVSRKAPRRSVP